MGLNFLTNVVLLTWVRNVHSMEKLWEKKGTFLQYHRREKCISNLVTFDFSHGKRENFSCSIFWVFSPSAKERERAQMSVTPLAYVHFLSLRKRWNSSPNFTTFAPAIVSFFPFLLA